MVNLPAQSCGRVVEKSRISADGSYINAHSKEQCKKIVRVYIYNKIVIAFSLFFDISIHFYYQISS